MNAILKLSNVAQSLKGDVNATNAIKHYFEGIVKNQDYRNGSLMQIPQQFQASFMEVGSYLAHEIKRGLQQGLQIHSPSRYFAWIGQMSAKGFAQGYARAAGSGNAQPVHQDNRQLIFNVHGSENLARDVRNNTELLAMAYGFT